MLEECGWQGKCCSSTYSQHGVTTFLKESGVVLILAVESEVAGVVNVVILQITNRIRCWDARTRDNEGSRRGGNRSKSEYCEGEHDVLVVVRGASEL